MLSCSDTSDQYLKGEHKNPTRTLPNDLQFLYETPTRPEGGYTLFQQPENNIDQKDALIRSNSLAPINYQEGGAGNINLRTTLEESLDILNLNYKLEDGRHVYKEGLVVLWREDEPITPLFIQTLPSYQGTLDFGPSFPEDKRHRAMGSSFADQFSEGVQNILEDEKAINFITSLYKFWENTEENCFEINKCQLFITADDSLILALFPKMIIGFGNDQRKNLSVIRQLNDDNPGCFSKAFDLQTKTFFCGVANNSQITINLGDNYKKALQLSGINPDLSINYGKDVLLQITSSTYIGWARHNFEEKVKKIPDTSYLSYISTSANYSAHFMINQSLIKVTIGLDNQVELSLDPLVSDENPVWTMATVAEKKQTLASLKPNTFYLSAQLPQLKDNYILQKNLVKALLDLLEQSEKNFYDNDVKTYTRFSGEYNDKQNLKATGLFISNSPAHKHPTLLEVVVSHSSGEVSITSILLNNPFAKQLVHNQAPYDINKSASKINGFALGDKIYLRNIDIGASEAIALYTTQDGKNLTALMEYKEDTYINVAYNTGNNNNITFQKTEIISTTGAIFFINPTLQTKEINGEPYSEYEINGIKSSSVYEGINNLCGIEGFDIKLGIYDRHFTETLEEKITQYPSTLPHQITPEKEANADTASNPEDENTDTANNQIKTPPKAPFTGCSYIAPLDPLFASVKRSYFFPEHKLVIQFDDREASSIAIYKKPSHIQESNQ